MKMTLFKILIAFLFAGLIGIGSIAAYRLYQFSDVPPAMVTNATMNDLIDKIEAAYRVKSTTPQSHGRLPPDHGCQLAKQVASRAPDDAWSHSIHLAPVMSCERGGCIFELRSASRDGRMNTKDDMTDKRLVSNCSGHDFSEQSLKHLNVVDANLSKANFGGSNLSAISIFRSNLQQASFRGATITCKIIEGGPWCVDIKESDLRKANFDGIRAEGLDLTGSLLFGSSFRDARITEFLLEGTRVSAKELRGVTVRAATCPDGTNVGDLTAEDATTKVVDACAFSEHLPAPKLPAK